jgi:hypothetical protein
MAKIDPVVPAGSPVYVEAVRSASALAGSNFSSVLSQVSQESCSRPTPRTAPVRRSARQFLESTWLDMMRRHGAAYGLGELADKIHVKAGKTPRPPGRAASNRFASPHGRCLGRTE